MADSKISALPAATTPLAGTEVLPIVQSGATDQVTIANLTAGRAVSALSYASTVATGTAPFTVASTTNVANLNASSLGGATFAAPGAIGGGTASTANFTILNTSGQVYVNRASGNNPGQLAFVNSSSGSIGASFTNSSIVSSRVFQIFLSSDATPIFKIGQAGVGDFLNIHQSGGMSLGSATDPGASNFSVAGKISSTGTISPQQATTAAAPAYVKGAMYFDTTLNKLRIGGATAWETVTSV